ncbi:cation:proton antiporter [Gordonia sp. NPDC003429]
MTQCHVEGTVRQDERVIVLAASESSSSAVLTLFWVALAAVLAPLIARACRGFVPEVVVLLTVGVVLGPHMLGWTDPDQIAVLSQLGLGMLFLLAGYELDPDLLRGRPGAVAGITWLVSLVLAGAVVGLLLSINFSQDVAVAIAMTSTALGTLLPILKADNLLGTSLGRGVMAHGAIGELGPILAMSLLLTSRSVVAAVVVIALFGVATVLLAVVPRRLAARVPGVRRVAVELGGGTTQLPIRVVLLLLLALMAIAAVFDLDVVLGAFAAGGILRWLIGEQYPVIARSLEVIGFGLLIPLFFVTSGMGIDPRAVTGNPLGWVVLVLGIGVARGVPVWFAERFVGRDAAVVPPRERVQLALYAATGLPIIVAVTQAAVDAELMSPTKASLLVAAGATTVLLFPLIARLIGARSVPQAGGIDTA